MDPKIEKNSSYLFKRFHMFVHPRLIIRSHKFWLPRIDPLERTFSCFQSQDLFGNAPVMLIPVLLFSKTEKRTKIHLAMLFTFSAPGNRSMANEQKQKANKKKIYFFVLRNKIRKNYFCSEIVLGNKIVTKRAP